MSPSSKFICREGCIWFTIGQNKYGGNLNKPSHLYLKTWHYNLLHFQLHWDLQWMLCLNVISGQSLFLLLEKDQFTEDDFWVLMNTDSKIQKLKGWTEWKFHLTKQLKQGTLIGLDGLNSVFDATKLSMRNVIVASFVRVLLLWFTLQIKQTNKISTDHSYAETDCCKSTSSHKQRFIRSD